MSFPSLDAMLDKCGIDETTPDDSPLWDEAYWAAFERDVPDGLNWLISIADDLELGETSDIVSEDPNSERGKQIARLLGTDIARPIVERRLQTHFTFYNCCSAVGHKPKPFGVKPKPSPRMQARLQRAGMRDC